MLSSSADPNQIQCFPHFCILFIMATLLATLQISPNLWTASKILVLPFQNNLWHQLIAPCWETGLFCNTVAIWAATAQKRFWSDNVNFPPFSITLTRLWRVANFCSTILFFWWVPGAVYSKDTPNLSCFQAFSNQILYLALSQQKHLTLKLYFESNSFLSSITWLFKSLF